MPDGLVPVLAIPGVMAAAWVGFGLYLQNDRYWATGGFVAGGLAATLVLIAAYLPLIGFFGALGVPALSVGAGVLLMRVFGNSYALAAAIPVPLAFLILLQPPVFPVVLPLILALPIWTVGWLERAGGAGRYALWLIASLVAVPVIVLGGFYLLRGLRGG